MIRNCESRTRRFGVTASALILAIALFGVQSASAQQTYTACYMPEVGVMYLINMTGLPATCLSSSHVEMTWTDGSGAVGVTDHGDLTGLGDDDHPEYLRDGEEAGGSLRGTYPNPTVWKLGQYPVSLAEPDAGDTWIFNGENWTHVPPPGGGVTDHGQLTGLGDDDHPEYIRAEEAAGGDLGGTYPNPTVAFLQGSAVSTTAPSSGQVLQWNGSAWTPQTPSGGGGVSDHGAMSGLGDDDHEQYLLADGVRSTTNGFAVTGSAGTGTIPIEGDGVRMMWYPGKGAFRAGRPNGASWDDGNIGFYSTALGHGTTASGLRSTALGSETTANGNNSTAMGRQTIASGEFSTAMGWETIASGDYSTAMGRQTIARGDHSTAMGVYSEASGAYSFASGLRAFASGVSSVAMGRIVEAGMGSFAFADVSTATVFAPGPPNSFTVRASGGVSFYTNSTQTSGVSLASGGGSWATVSDRNMKENFLDLDGEEALTAIASMPIQTWNYKAQDPSNRHMGPMAQDFYSAFGLGHDDKHINTVDIDGVNMLGVQALEIRTRDLKAENDLLKSRVEKLEAALLRIEALVSGRER